jgi:hypothetical protein
MRRADMERHEKEIRGLPVVSDRDQSIESLQTFYRKWIILGFGGDDKPDNYGYYQDQLVKVDYGQ